MARKPKADSLKEMGQKFYETRSEKIFTDLYYRIRPGLYNYVYQILKDTDLTNHVVSAVMTTVYNKIDTYDPKWHISTWIYRIAYTAACMEIRYKKAARTTPMSYFENSENKNWVSQIEFESIDGYKDILIAAEEEAEEKSNNTRLRNIVSELPEEYRHVIFEKFFNDLKYDEIAEKLEIPLHTVKNRISRGKKLIKEIYEK
jgi:RNA polymerase sigma-70 factor (ECF subfamily)